MPIVQNRAYNDPALGAAFSNIAQLFAPPSGSDLAGYAAAGAKKAEAARIAELYAAAGRPDFNQSTFDRQAIAAGLYNPTQGYYAQDQNNATTRYGVDTTAATARRGQDLSASTALTTNAANNDRALIEAAMGAATAPVSQGAIRPGFNPADYGVSAPAVPEFKGATAPLSETQQIARERQTLIDAGLLTPDMQIDTIVGDKAPVQAVDASGKPVYMSPGAAVRQGAAPYKAPTGATETQNYRTPDGVTGTAFFDTSANTWKDTSTQAPIPERSITFNSSLQGSASETGLAPTTANNTQSNSLEATLNATEADANNLLQLLAANPGIAGLPGDIRGAAQNAVSVVGEMSQAFGNLAPDAVITADQAQSALRSIAPSRDPAIQQYKTGLANLAYRVAQMNNPSGEVSRQAYERALESLQGGLLANNQSSTEALNALKEQIGRTRETQLRTLRNPGQDVPAAPAAPRAPIPPGTIEDGFRFKGGDPSVSTNWEAVQ